MYLEGRNRALGETRETMLQGTFPIFCKNVISRGGVEE